MQAIWLTWLENENSDFTRNVRECNKLNINCFKDTLKASEDFKNKQKVLCSFYVCVCVCVCMCFVCLFCFFYIKVYLFWKFVQCTTDKTQIFRKICFGQNKRCKNALSRELQIITILLLIRDSFMSWSTRLFSRKALCGIYHFRISFVFIKVYIFVQQKAWTL